MVVSLAGIEFFAVGSFLIDRIRSCIPSTRQTTRYVCCVRVEGGRNVIVTSEGRCGITRDN